MKAWLLTACCLLATTATAADAYIVQGFARGPNTGSYGDNILWSTDVLFFNKGSSDATIRFLGVSNGITPVAQPTFMLPAGRNAALTRLALSWLPGTFDPLWILHLDVPDDVVVESVLFIGTEYAPGGAPPQVRPRRYGKLRLPVARLLVPASQGQFHLGTWLGDSSEIPSRINVGVYNGGSTTATARIEVRQGCDNTVIDQRTVTVPVNTLLQVTGMRTGENACPQYTPGTIGGPSGSMYTVVTVDQPSITFVSNLANTIVPTTSIGIN